MKIIAVIGAGTMGNGIAHVFAQHHYKVHLIDTNEKALEKALETIEIKRLWPKYNRALKGYEASYGLYSFEDGNGYLRLAVDRKHKHLPAVHLFYSRYEGVTELKRLIKEFDLCNKLCFIDRSTDPLCSAEGCKGACNGTETAAAYNERVKKAVDQLKQELPSFAIRERSYFNEKDSCILMEGGRFYGMGYVATEFDFTAKDELRSQLQEYPEYDFVRNIIKRYALEQPDKVVWL